ncbi:MATE family efflux transporter, partial [uncultured Muribaculum sp.]
AFSIACYYCPFVFMIGNAIAQSAQPIISYNYGKGSKSRVIATEKLAILAALGCGLAITAAFIFTPSAMVHLFLDPDLAAAKIAVKGFPVFSVAFIAFIFNLTAIGYFQSVEKVTPSIVFALLRGLIFLVPAFILLPTILNATGIWLALGISEILTALSIVGFYIYNKSR